MMIYLFSQVILNSNLLASTEWNCNAGKMQQALNFVHVNEIKRKSATANLFFSFILNSFYFSCSLLRVSIGLV